MTAKTREPGLAQPQSTPADNPLAPERRDKTSAGARLTAAFGTADNHFLGGLVEQLARAGLQRGDIDEARLGFMISAVDGIKPRDHLEVMLAAQMAAVHIATMTFAERLRCANNTPSQDIAERVFNKLARTFATQVEALKRYRTGGEKVTVQHVSVSEGGQAIVGNVTQPARETAGGRT